ncbi:MAG: pyruvate decarboxylase [Chryseobacterium sp.]|nr:MAG: pyruvate decarboxylase [Chryseobacterium sp.]
MKKPLSPFYLTIYVSILLISCANYGDSLLYKNKNYKIPKIKTVLYFNPEVFPDISEIKEPTYSAFYTATSDKMKSLGNIKYLQIDTPISFDDVDTKTVKEICQNNNADVAVVPKVKYFKVGFGKYVLSNQVIVSMKLYDSNGQFIMETSYDTYKGNGRLLGSAANSVIIGTKGAIRKMDKELKTDRFPEQSF